MSRHRNFQSQASRYLDEFRQEDNYRGDDYDDEYFEDEDYDGYYEDDQEVYEVQNDAFDIALAAATTNSKNKNKKNQGTESNSNAVTKPKSIPVAPLTENIPTVKPRVLNTTFVDTSYKVDITTEKNGDNNNEVGSLIDDMDDLTAGDSNTTSSKKQGRIVANTKSFLKKKNEVVQKLLDENKSQKPIVNVAVVGHVDSGKSTLIGHLLYKQGRVTQAEMRRLEIESRNINKGSFKFAWVLDQNTQERQRGITVDVGHNWFETTDRRITILDCPGHRDFVPMLLTGAAQAEAGILVVAATPGEFEAGFILEGQTKEHAILLRALGVSSLLIAVNKMDAASTLSNDSDEYEKYPEERFNEIKDLMSPFLESLGFLDITFIPVSGLEGVNLASSPPETSPLSRWYNGPSIISHINQFQPLISPTESAQPLRMVISDVFTTLKYGLTVSGKILSGSLVPKEHVLLMPQGVPCSIKATEISNVPVKAGLSGEILEIALKDVDEEFVKHGCILSDISNPVPLVSKFRATIISCQTRGSFPILPGMELLFYSQGAVTTIAVTKIIGIVPTEVESQNKDKNTPLDINDNMKDSGADSDVTKKIANNHQTSLKQLSKLGTKDGEKKQLLLKKARFIPTNSVAQVELTFKSGNEVCLDTEANCMALSRFTLRREGNTIAVGVVEEIIEQRNHV